MLVIQYLLDLISLVFLVSFVFILILWTFFLRSAPQYDIVVFPFIFWTLGAWMVGITLFGIAKIINFFYLSIRRK